MTRRWNLNDLAHAIQKTVARTPDAPVLTNVVEDPYRFGLLCAENGLPRPVAEHRFHHERKFRWDFAWPAHRIAVEIDGGIWRRGGGAHSRPAAIERDIEKGNLGVLCGWRVLRYTPQNLSAAIADVRRLISQGGES